MIFHSGGSAFSDCYTLSTVANRPFCTKALDHTGSVVSFNQGGKAWESVFPSLFLPEYDLQWEGRARLSQRAALMKRDDPDSKQLVNAESPLRKITE